MGQLDQEKKRVEEEIRGKFREHLINNGIVGKHDPNWENLKLSNE